MADRKYDWDTIEELRGQGKMWREVVEELALDVDPRYLGKQYAKRRRRGTGVAPRSMIKSKGGTSLVDFAHSKRMEQKRALCVICQLDESVRSQLATASERGITRKEQIAWLEEVIGVRVTLSQIQAHFAGRHDE